METYSPYLLFIGLAVIIFILWNTKRVIIYEYERGVLFKRGKFERILAPGQHWYFRPGRSVKVMDIRTMLVSLPGQEVLSGDNVGVKISLICSIKVEDPYKALVEVENYLQAVYAEIQVGLRDIVGETPIEEFLSKRKVIGEELTNRTRQKISDYGVTLESVAIKDIMFPGELKQIFAQVVNAKKEGLAALERARGESAAMRNLANTAKLLEKRPGLLQLRILQTLDKNPGHTIILGDIADKDLLKKKIKGKKDKKSK